MNKNEIFQLLVSRGFFSSPNMEELEICEDLVKEGIALKCSAIKHSAVMINPNYTYVSNDEKGLQMALTPLCTIQFE